MKITQLDFPPIPALDGAMNIIQKLNQAGKLAYFAGGSVRDAVMGNNPSDIDMATSASPEEIISLFRRTVAVGKAFGVIVVIMGDYQYEVATFRKDGLYVDGRRPIHIDFASPEEDVMRRDFTVNGLLYNPLTRELMDYVGGMDDILTKTIRTIGNPEERFTEDKLRLLRCIRFAVRLDFQIEKDTFRAVKKLSGSINEISKERIASELEKILTSRNPAAAVRLLDESGLLDQILPEVSRLKGVEQPEEFHPEGDVFEHTIKMLELGKDFTFPLALAVLLHDIGKPATQEFLDRIRFNLHEKEGAKMAALVCERLKLSNSITERVCNLVLHHMRFKDVQKMKISTLKKFLRMDYFPEHLELHRLDCLSSHGLLDNYHFCLQKLQEFSEEKEALKPEILLNGNDLKKLGLKPGPLFTVILSELEDHQLENKIASREQAISWIKEKYL